MYYELNVSHKGRHLFATHERSVCSMHEANHLLNLFVQKFPTVSGFLVTVTEKHLTGHDVTNECATYRR